MQALACSLGDQVASGVALGGALSDAEERGHGGGGARGSGERYGRQGAGVQGPAPGDDAGPPLPGDVRAPGSPAAEFPRAQWPGAFWLQSAATGEVHLCVLHSLVGPLAAFWAVAHHLMQDAGRGMEPVLQCNQGPRGVECMLRGLPRDLFWMTGSFGPAGEESVGIGRNKDAQVRATKLALALTRMCGPNPPRLAWPPPVGFDDLVGHARLARASPLRELPPTTALVEAAAGRARSR